MTKQKGAMELKQITSTFWHGYVYLPNTKKLTFFGRTEDQLRTRMYHYCEKTLGATCRVH